MDHNLGHPGQRTFETMLKNTTLKELGTELKIGEKKGKKIKRDVAEELVHSEDNDEELKDIKKMSTAELLDIIAEAEEDEIYTSGGEVPREQMTTHVNGRTRRHYS